MVPWHGTPVDQKSASIQAFLFTKTMLLRNLLLTLPLFAISCSPNEVQVAQESGVVQSVEPSDALENAETGEHRNQPVTGIANLHSFRNTGVKTKVLVGALNWNGDLEEKFHHDFQHFGDSENVSVYQDTKSSLALILVGPPDDLLSIELTMPVKEFIGEQADGSVTGEGAAAFGRCVQRLGAAIDPSWVEDLYAWMNDKMTFALIAENGATLKYKHLIVVFDTDRFPNDEMMINFVFGIPETE